MIRESLANPALQTDSGATVGALRALIFDAAAAERSRLDIKTKRERARCHTLNETARREEHVPTWASSCSQASSSSVR